jgi:hypothetical protein
VNEKNYLYARHNTAIGIALILLGILLLLSRLGIIFLSWQKIAWVFAMVAGGYLAVEGIISNRRRRVFWGSLLFFVSLYHVLRWWFDVHDHLLWLPSMAIALGLSYLIVFLNEPQRVTLLLPAFLFIGGGVLGILWWMEYIQWFELEDALRTYWPLALVAWGVTLLVRRQ